MEPQRGAGSTPAATGSAFIVNPPIEGNVRYSWIAGDTDIPGGYDGRWVVTYQDGTIESFPNDGPFSIAIHAKKSPQSPVVLLASMEAFAEARGVRHDPADPKALRALEDASSLFRSLARQTITRVDDDAVELRGNWSRRLWVPERPLIDVTALTITDDAALLWTIQPSSLRISRRGLIRQAFLGAGSWGGTWGGPDATVRITYSHGNDEIPDDVEATVISLAARRLQNIVNAASQTISAYAVDFGGLSSDEQSVIMKYRPTED